MSSLANTRERSYKEEREKLLQENAELRARLSLYEKVMNQYKQVLQKLASIDETMEVQKDLPAKALSFSSSRATTLLFGIEDDVELTEYPEVNHILESIAKIDYCVSAIKLWNEKHPANTFAITKGLINKWLGFKETECRRYFQKNEDSIREYNRSIGAEPQDVKGFNRRGDRPAYLPHLVEFVQKHLIKME